MIAILKKAGLKEANPGAKASCCVGEAG